MASGISGNIVPESIGESDFPGESYPEYINIQFNDYLLSDTFHTAQISIYPVQPYEEVGEYVTYNIQLLADLVQRRPESFQCNEDMPFLPLWNAAQLFSAQTKFVDFNLALDCAILPNTVRLMRLLITPTFFIPSRD